MKSRQRRNASGVSKDPLLCRGCWRSAGAGLRAAQASSSSEILVGLEKSVVNVGTLRGRSGEVGEDGRQKAFGLFVAYRKQDGKEMVLTV